MSNRYRATFAVHTGDVEAAYASALSTIGEHCPVDRSDWNPTGTTDLYILTFTFHAASDVEAKAIVQDAGRSTKAPFDSERITSNGGRRQVR